MLPKQDRVRPRTPSDLEHKYNLGELQIAADGSLYRLIDADGSLYRLFEGEKEYLNMIPGKWAKVYDSENKPTIEEIGAAPDGYGLGANSGTLISDLNTCVRNGWYYTNEETLNVNDVYSRYASVHVTARTSKQIVQRLVSVGHGTKCELLRYTTDGGANWTEEWVKPPMVQNAKFRTTERWMGKAVYCSMIYVAALPNNSWTEIRHGIPATNIVRCEGVSGDGWTIPYTVASARIDLGCNIETLYITTTADYSYIDGYITIYYTMD